MARFLLQVAVLLTMVGPVAGFAQSDNGPPPFYVIQYFRISGSVGASTEDHNNSPRLVQSESMRESLNWVLGRSELIRSVDLRSNWKVIEKSKTPTPLDSIKQQSFEIKRRARTDRISAEMNVSAALVASDAGITVKGLQSITLDPIHDDYSRSHATMSVSFGVKVGAEGIVRIFGCDVFDKSHFQNQPGFQIDGENCSFQVREQYAGQFKAKPSSGTAKLIESMPANIRVMLAPQTPGYPLHFSADLEAKASGRFGENTQGVVLAKPFKITIGKECDADTPKVNISNGNRPGPFNKNYKECSRKIVNALHENKNFPGLKKIGGPNKRCIDAGPKRSKKEWFDTTDGSCKSKDFSGYKDMKNKTKFNSIPNPAKPGYCSAGGPVFTKAEMFVKTGGTCTDNNGYESKKSSHADGFGLDLFVTDEKKPKTPGGCVLDAGDRIAEWARTNADAYGIKNVIWNRMIASNSSNWLEEDYSGADTKPHYDHVHIQCEN